ncbi:MAG TPA: hypothetical protein VG477_15015, partial [Thermoanaerobaculia bacterium]|nr:hypothetical protein [Thermoanaerobaculia bacterium]
DTWWGWLLSIWTAVQNVWSSLFGIKLDGEMTVPIWAAWVTLVGCCLLCLWLLSRRIKAYEVVR